MLGRLALGLGVLLGSTACFTPSLAHRDELHNRVATDPSRSYAGFRQLARHYGLPISHWPDSTLADSLERAGVEGPCGPENILWVKRLQSTTARHSLDRVLEYDDSTVLREWLIPANEVPRAVRGDALVLPLAWYPDSVTVDSASLAVLLVTPDGALRVGRDARGIGWPPTEECPPHAASARSDFWACRVFIDQQSGQRRRLAFDGVCT